MKNSSRSSILAALAALMLAVSPVVAQAQDKPAAKPEPQAQLKAEAKISLAKAKKTALAQVPHGTIKSSELEREKGKLIYSFDIATKGKSGIDEVNVDAVTGALVGGVEHESPKAEKADAKAEAKKP
jgi:uncharacterized membrane protein YkoI